MKKVSTIMYSLIVLILAFGSTQAQQAFRNPVTGVFDQTENLQSYKMDDNQNRNPQDIFFEEGFESGDFTTNAWQLSDADGDGLHWVVSGNYTPHTGAFCAGSASWTSTGGAINPDNWMATKAIDLSTAAGTVLLDYWVRAQDQVWPSDHYGVYASTTGQTPADFTGADGALLFEETIEKGTDSANNLYVKRTVDLSAYAGASVYVAFRHFNSSDWFVMDIDDVVVYTSNTADVGLAGVVAPNNEANCTLGSEEPVTVSIFNFGGAEQTGFEVSYTLNGNTVTETFDGVVAPASSVDYTFMQTADLSALGYYTIDFAVNLDGDIDTSNDTFSHQVSSTDAEVVIEVSTDSNGGQAWELISSNGDVIATHGAYQWNITETTKVCVIADDCYRFNWYSFDGTSNTVSVYYNGDLVNTTAAAGNFTLYSVGGACKPLDAIFYAHNIQEYGVVGNASFGGSFLNTGSENITAFDVQYSVDGVASSVETVSGVNVSQGESYDFAHSTPFNFMDIGSYDVELTISNLNGSYTPEANSLSATVNVLSYKPTTRVLGEEATGTWCGWCTRGHVFMELMEQTYPDTWVGVAVHNGDPMVVTNYDQAIGAFISGYPSGLVNRYSFGGSYDVDPSLFEDAYGLLINQVVPADVSISAAEFDPNTRQLQFKVNATFAGDIAKDFNVNAIIIENEVTGTTTGYDQVNYYSGGASGPMGGYEDLPATVPAKDMVYQNVARVLMSGWDGASGIVANPTADGGNYHYTYNYTVPAGENTDHLVIIGVVSDAVSGQVINVNKVDMNTAVTVKDVESLVDFNVYPNPSSDVFNIELSFDNPQNVSIYVTDFNGRVVSTLEENSSVDFYQSKINMTSFNPGVYFLNVKSAKGISVKKIIKL